LSLRALRLLQGEAICSQAGGLLPYGMLRDAPRSSGFTLLAMRPRRTGMLIARVIGTTVSTVKDEKLTGRKLLILRQSDETGSPSGKPYVAVDTVDAGVGDLVLTCAGSSARQTNITKDTPVDAVIMAVIDSLEVEGKVVFRKS